MNKLIFVSYEDLPSEIIDKVKYDNFPLVFCLEYKNSKLVNYWNSHEVSKALRDSCRVFSVCEEDLPKTINKFCNEIIERLREIREYYRIIERRKEIIENG